MLQLSLRDMGISAMPKFKVGDWVVCIDGISEGYGGPKKGEKFLVTSVQGDSVGFKLKRLDNDIYRTTTIDGTKPNWGTECFELDEWTPFKKNLEEILK